MPTLDSEKLDLLKNNDIISRQHALKWNTEIIKW